MKRSESSLAFEKFWNDLSRSGDPLHVPNKFLTAWNAAWYEQEKRIEQLTSALERTLRNFELILSYKPVRDASETIAEAHRALAASRPEGTHK